MKKVASVTGEFDVRWLFDDLGLEYASRPFYRIEFELEPVTIQRLAERFANHVFRSVRRATPQGLELVTVVLRFDAETFVLAMGSHRQTGEVYAATAERAEAVYRLLEPLLAAKEAVSKPCFQMLRFDGCEISTEEITDVPELLAGNLMELYYGADIAKWIRGFDERSRNKIGGITVLEGAPGTGKTTLVSQLIVRLAATHAFYVLPAGNDGALSSPEFVPFWVRQNEQYPHKVKVIVMEDAERVLLRRDADNQAAISSLLNIADGLMGRMLRLHLLCSLNAKLEELDPAILRPGRLLSYRHFGLLSKENAVAIARVRGTTFEPAFDREEFTLAEVLNPPVIEDSKPEVRIGF